VDLPAVLLLLLVAAFILLAVTVGYGFATKTLDPGIVLGVVGTMFTGLTAGALTAYARKPAPPPPPDPPPPELDP
jgi:phosphotransferase system  glucose/maltose/N-acetylglucosamine-specific IIC component